jgi:GT2 family glycosyltransferase
VRASPALSVVIPTLGRRPVELSRALERLAGQDEGDFEVVLGLDADADAAADVAALAAQAHALAVEVRRAARPGASAARNAGWRAARAPCVLFLDDDILASPRLVAEHLAGHAAEPGGAVAVLGHVAWARELRPTPLMRWLDRGVQFQYPFLRDGEDAGWGNLYTANASLPRAALERVGGFDEDAFPFGYEDLDLGRRLHDALGLRVVYRRAAEAEHLHDPQLAEWRARVGRIARSERRFVERYPDVPPYFHERFAAAAQGPPPHGRGAHLARVVKPGTPWLGPKVWASVDAVYWRELSAPFLEAWEEEQSSHPSPASGG